jgi:hypothetical protein
VKFPAFGKIGKNNPAYKAVIIAQAFGLIVEYLINGKKLQKAPRP